MEFTLFDDKDIPATGWINVQFPVLATGTNTVLQFGARNDPNAFALDDIVVQPLPGIASISRFTLTTRERESDSPEGTQVLISGGKMLEFCV